MAQSGSFSPNSDISSDTNSAPEKTRKPDNTAFKQQRLPAWQPILTAQSVLPAFFIIFVLFLPLGIVLLLASEEVVEVSTDYTHCNSSTCADLRNNVSRMSEACTCNVSLEVPKAMQGVVYVYYGLSNFFQNHRRYVKSRDDNQLNGKSVSLSSLNADCKPYDNVNSTPIAPCGAIANSLFNDTFAITNNDGGTQASILRTGIAWPTDKTQKFNNPDGGPNPVGFKDTAKPVFWQKPVYELDPSDDENNGYENDALIVWMRSAAFPTFRKPYGRITTGLPAGNYVVTVDYNFPVVSFAGTKRIILSTTSWVGGKNNFLGIAYIVVASLCFFIGIALCVVHHITKNSVNTATTSR